MANCAVVGLGLLSTAFVIIAQSPNAQTFEAPVTLISGLVTRRPRWRGSPSRSINGLGDVPIEDTTVAASINSPLFNRTPVAVISCAPELRRTSTPA